MRPDGTGREAELGAFTTTDFATLLDEVIAAAAAEEERAGPRPSIPFDPLLGEPVEERIADPIAAAEYLFLAAERFEVTDDTPPLVPDLPSIDPVDIAMQLGLTGKEKAPALDQMRRDFAFANHPDRVAMDLRDRAIVRMQIANRMIDEAKRRLRKS